MLSENPAKRWFEKFALVYSLVWIAVVVVVMATRAPAGWRDLGHMMFGVGVALPLWIAPLFAPQPAARQHALRFNLWVGLFSFLQCYFGSYLFFDVLGMEYHFKTTWEWNKTPVFLYFTTVAYFSTYYVIMSLAWRAVRRRLSSRIAWTAALLVLGYLTAFAETAGMANDWLREFFFYRDKTFTLIYGSICYGTLFVLSLPFVFRIDEDSGDPPPTLPRLTLEVLGVNMLALVFYEIYRHVFPAVR